VAFLQDHRSFCAPASRPSALAPHIHPYTLLAPCWKQAVGEAHRGDPAIQGRSGPSTVQREGPHRPRSSFYASPGDQNAACGSTFWHQAPLDLHARLVENLAAQTAPGPPDSSCLSLLATATKPGHQDGRFQGAAFGAHGPGCATGLVGAGWRFSGVLNHGPRAREGSQPTHRLGNNIELCCP